MIWLYSGLAGLLSGGYFWLLYKHRGAALGIGLFTGVGVWWFNG